MTYTEAQKMIEIHGEYVEYLGEVFKRKIVPLKPSDYIKFITDILENKVYVSNTDVQMYSSDGNFAINSYRLDFINEQ